MLAGWDRDPALRVLKDIPLTIRNISLDEQHWVSIEPWVTAPLTTEPGNVRTREVTLFEFTPADTGTFIIRHTVHGFSGTLRVEDPFPSVEVSGNFDGDFDGDFEVGFGDFLLFAAAFGSTLGEEVYRAELDLDGNGAVDFPDFLQFAGLFGTKYTKP